MKGWACQCHTRYHCGKVGKFLELKPAAACLTRRDHALWYGIMKHLHFWDCLSGTFRILSPKSKIKARGKGRKLAWQGSPHARHENRMMLRMLMLPNLLPVATGRQCFWGGLSHGPNCL